MTWPNEENSDWLFTFGKNYILDRYQFKRVYQTAIALQQSVNQCIYLVLSVNPSSFKIKVQPSLSNIFLSVTEYISALYQQPTSSLVS